MIWLITAPLFPGTHSDLIPDKGMHGDAQGRQACATGSGPVSDGFTILPKDPQDEATRCVTHSEKEAASMGHDISGKGDWIRTSGLVVPNDVRYRKALHPVQGPQQPDVSAHYAESGNGAGMIDPNISRIGPQNHVPAYNTHSGIGTGTSTTGCHISPVELEIIESAFTAGLQTLLLRKPGWTEKEYAAWLEHLPARHRDKVMVSTFHALVTSFGLKGLHLSGEARATTAPEVIRQLRDAGKWVSTSIHGDPGDFSAFDFVLQGPVFDSISKTGHTARQYEHIPSNALALGGVHAGNIEQVRKRGYCGAAILGAVWHQAVSAADVVKQLIAAWDRVNDAINQSNARL